MDAKVFKFNLYGVNFSLVHVYLQMLRSKFVLFQFPTEQFKNKMSILNAKLNEHILLNWFWNITIVFKLFANFSIYSIDSKINSVLTKINFIQ